GLELRQLVAEPLDFLFRWQRVIHRFFGAMPAVASPIAELRLVQDEQAGDHHDCCDSDLLAHDAEPLSSTASEGLETNREPSRTAPRLESISPGGETDLEKMAKGLLDLQIRSCNSAIDINHLSE